MAILDHHVLLNSFNDDYMNENVELLEAFNKYHCLRKASSQTVTKAKKILGSIPASFEEWLNYCDGGVLFDTVMLSTEEYDKELDLDFETYDEYNSAEAKEGMALPQGYSVFAIRSYGDPICFNCAANDGKVYLWNRETAVFEDIWDTFEDWLTDEIDAAVQLIGDGDLEPLGIKLGYK